MNNTQTTFMYLSSCATIFVITISYNTVYGELVRLTNYLIGTADQWC